MKYFAPKLTRNSHRQNYRSKFGQYCKISEATTGGVLYKKSVLKNFSKFKGKHLCQSPRLWCRCFPVDFAKFSRTPLLQKTSGRLLLKYVTQGHYAPSYERHFLNFYPPLSNENEYTRSLKIGSAHSFPIHSFSTLWKHQKTLRFSDVSGGRERLHWGRMGQYVQPKISLEKLLITLNGYGTWLLNNLKNLSI